MERPLRPLIKEDYIRISIEDVKRVNGEIIQNAKEQLEVIGPSLRDLATRIEVEKPEVLIFLDKSARPFGTAFKKYLEETMGESAPKIRFYNDAHLKQAYLDNAHQKLQRVASEDFAGIAGKKVFFVDETYSRGRGVAALQSIEDTLGHNFYYFALSSDPIAHSQPLHTGNFHRSEEQHAEVIARVQQNPHFVLYPSPITRLFSRDISRLYVEDTGHGSTYGIWGETDELDEERMLSIKDVLRPSEGVSQEEFDTELRQTVFETVRSVKEEIYRTLKGS